MGWGRAMVSFVRGRMMSRAVMRGFVPAVMLTVAATWVVAHMAAIALVMTGAAVLLRMARVVSMVAGRVMRAVAMARMMRRTFVMT